MSSPTSSRTCRPRPRPFSPRACRFCPTRSSRDDAGPAGREELRRRPRHRAPRRSPTSPRRPSLTAALERIGRPAVLKTRRFGYDGKGQAHDQQRHRSRMPPGARSAASPASSKLSCRSSAKSRWSRRAGSDGAVECFDVTENEHRDHILKTSRVPAALSRARTPRRRAASPKSSREAFGYVGVLAVEMFVLRRQASLLVNEIAPRVHNSGHWTLDGASVSQFEQHIRAVAGWPLGQTAAPRPGRDDQSDRPRGAKIIGAG